MGASVKKICRTCRLPDKEYHSYRRSGKVCVRNECKECYNARCREQKRKWLSRPEVKSQQKERIKKYYYKNHDKVRVYQNEWNTKTGKGKERAKKHYHKNKDKINKKAIEERKGAYWRSYAKQWDSNNKDRRRVYRKKQKPKQVQRVKRGRHELKDWYVVYTLQKQGFDNPSKELIELKRIQIQVKRALK